MNELGGVTFNSDYQLLIHGGTVLIYAEGDGFDSNGIAIMTGGTAIVRGPTRNDNGAIDAGSFDISGGVLIAVGSAGMAEGVDGGSEQVAIEAVLGQTRPAGTVIPIESSDGEPAMTGESAGSPGRSTDFAYRRCASSMVVLSCLTDTYAR